MSRASGTTAMRRGGRGGSLGLAASLLVLIQLGCHGVAPLREGDPDVEVSLIQKAGVTDDPTLTEPLLHFLTRWLEGEQSPDDAPNLLYYQVLAASLALGDRGDTEAIPLLLELIEDPRPWIRANAAEALALLGGPEAHAALRRLATDSSPHVRRAAGAGNGSGEGRE